MTNRPLKALYVQRARARDPGEIVTLVTHKDLGDAVEVIKGVRCSLGLVTLTMYGGNTGLGRKDQLRIGLMKIHIRPATNIHSAEQAWKLELWSSTLLLTVTNPIRSRCDHPSIHDSLLPLMLQSQIPPYGPQITSASSYPWTASLKPPTSPLTYGWKSETVLSCGSSLPSESISHQVASITLSFQVVFLLPQPLK